MDTNTITEAINANSALLHSDLSQFISLVAWFAGLFIAFWVIDLVFPK